MTADPGEPPSRGLETRVPAVSASSAEDAEPISTTPHKPWRPSHFWASFRHAGDGVRETFQAERNFRVHVVAGVLVFLAGLLLHLSPLALAVLVLSIALVLAMELVNTAIEAAVDLAMPQWHPLARRAKDAAAGAVLIAAVLAVGVGLLLFLPALMPYGTLLVRRSLPSLIAFALPVVVIVTVLAYRRIRPAERSTLTGDPLDLSRKAVMGVALAVFLAACACRVGAILLPATTGIGAISSLPHTTPTPSAGVP